MSFSPFSAKGMKTGFVFFFDNMSVIVREHPEKLHYIEEPKY